jgi:hypothetical protein
VSENEPVGETLSQTQFKWKQKYRREQKRATKLEQELHETRAELERHKKAFRDLAQTAGLSKILSDLIGNS